MPDGYFLKNPLKNPVTIEAVDLRALRSSRLGNARWWLARSKNSGLQATGCVDQGKG